MDIDTLTALAAGTRRRILISTNQADSGHPTSSLSAVELMVGLMFGGTFRYDVTEPEAANNDRLIFSKGHASPLFYALWAAAGAVEEKELLRYREFGSRMEGHPSVDLPVVEAATGSLGQGLAIGVGMALNAKYLDKLPYRTYVLLGDSEMAEGSQWESIQIATHYELDNLVGILDVNRLGQTGETMYGHDLDAYRTRLEAFGWDTIPVDGHDLAEVLAAYEQATGASGPVMVIGRTVKGKGVPSVEDENGWHGKALGEEALEEAEASWQGLDLDTRGAIAKPDTPEPMRSRAGDIEEPAYVAGDMVATRDAYGDALKRIYPRFPEIVSVDGEVSNSTRAQTFAEAYPDRFFEMYIAEQNMVGVALGLSRRGRKPFVSTFAAFMTRAYDQIRMSQYSDADIVFAGSHAGVSIGEDGPSQMGLEDLAMFRAIRDSVVLYPSDAVSADRLVEAAAEQQGIVYIRTTRAKTPVIYSLDDVFRVGGSRTVRSSAADRATVISAGYTLHEALAACDELAEEDISVRVVDAYSIKPVDRTMIEQAAAETGFIMVVEDHYAAGGLGEAVLSALAGRGVGFRHLAVTRKPRSGSVDAQLDYQGLSARRIADAIRGVLSA